MRMPFVTVIGTVDVEIHFMPADPDSGFPNPYVDETMLYYTGTDTQITLEDDLAITPEVLLDIERAYIRELNEQAALARAIRRGEEWD